MMPHIVNIFIWVVLLIGISSVTPKKAFKIHIPAKARLIVGCPAGHRTPQENYEDPCSSEEFQCSNGKCIKRTYLCDGEQDCLDGTDEYNCPAVSPALDWLSVGFDKFVRFNQTMTWDDARTLCRSHGLDLYKYKDIEELSKYLDINFSSERYWLGGRGNGTHQVWLSGDVVPNPYPGAVPWYSDWYPNVGINDCLMFVTSSGWPGPTQGRVQATTGCDDDFRLSVLCA